MTLTIPQHRDPVARFALVACALALAWLAISSVLPAASAKEEPQVVIVVATPTLPAGAPDVAPGLAAPTAAPADPIVAAAPANEAPASHIVQHADGSTSLPGSEAWMAPQLAVTNTDPQLQIARDAAAAYQPLPPAAAPSAENAQPVTVRRPHTGR